MLWAEYLCSLNGHDSEEMATIPCGYVAGEHRCEIKNMLYSFIIEIINK